MSERLFRIRIERNKRNGVQGIHYVSRALLYLLYTYAMVLTCWQLEKIKQKLKKNFKTH